MPTLTHSLLLSALPDGNHTFLSVALAIVAIGLLIFFHEMGHFLACRLTKTRVEAFSMGFGPRLFGWETIDGKRRMTVGKRRSDPADGLDVRISAIPLGGYVKMAGEIGGDGSPGSVGDLRLARGDEFPQKPFFAKVFIISAGVLMNVILAVALYAIAYGSGINEVPPLVGGVVPGEAAWSAGLLPGDRILSYGGNAVGSFDSFKYEVLFSSSSSEPEIVVRRNGKPLSMKMKPRFDEEKGLQLAGVTPTATWTVNDGKVTFEVGPTEEVSIDGRPVVGGMAAATLAYEAWTVGKRSIVIGPHIVPLPAFPADAKPAGSVKLGVTVPLIVEKVRAGSPAEAKGVLPRDRIVSVDGVPAVRSEDLDLLSKLMAVTVLRDGKEIVIDAGAADGGATGLFLDGIAFRAKPEAKSPAAVVPDGRSFAGGKSPAAEAGIAAGDVVVEIAGKPVATWDDLQAIVKELGPETVAVKVKGRDGAVRELRVTPAVPLEMPRADDFFGAARLSMPKEPVPISGVFDAISHGARRALLEAKNIFRMIGRFFGGEISPAKTLGGPVMIVNLSSRMALEGLATFLAFIAWISVNLAVLNILPVPVLDGGSLMILIIEKARGGKPLKETTIGIIQWAGFALLMLLMVFALKNDFGTVFH